MLHVAKLWVRCVIYVAACDQTLDFSSSVVRVGEYDLSKEKDCFDFPPDDCADEVQVQFSSPSTLSSGWQNLAAFRREQKWQ